MEKVKIITMDELTSLIDRKVIIKDKQIGIFLTGNGQVHAINNVCPHREGPLSEGTINGKYTYCPLHDQKTDLNIGKAQEPDTGCVETYQVEIQDGGVLTCL